MNDISRSADLAAAAAELEAEGVSLEGLAIRLSKLSKIQQKQSNWFSDDWPDDVKISYDEMSSKLRSAEEAFRRNLPIYPKLEDQWRDRNYYQDKIFGSYGFGKDAFGHFLHYEGNAHLLKKCACIALGMSRAFEIRPDQTSYIIGEFNKNEGGYTKMVKETNINTGVAGAVGSRSHVHDNIIGQAGEALQGIDMVALSQELARLRSEMKNRGSEPDHDEALGEVAKAQKAADLNDAQGAFEHLKAAGKWTLDLAKEIGVSVASDAIKKSMGISG